MCGLCVCLCGAIDGTSKTQINKVLSHPTLPIVVSAHEDKYIKFYDVNSGMKQALIGQAALYP